MGLQWYLLLLFQESIKSLLFYGFATNITVLWAQVGFIDPNVAVARVRPIDFESAARRACDTRLDDAKATFPRVVPDNLPYLCMDLVYQYTLLVDGFG